jgi:Domain of unknown function (DUF317)
MPPKPETVEVDFIAPRHLAGGGDPAWVTVPLHRACGWSHGNDPLMPRVLLSSPDQKALLRLEPDPDRHWWTLRHAAVPDQPAWYVSFGARTPVELIAAVTDALTTSSPAPGIPSDRPRGNRRQAHRFSSRPTAPRTSSGRETQNSQAPGTSLPHCPLTGRCGRPASASTPRRTWSPRSPQRSATRAPWRVPAAGTASRPPTRPL